MACTGTFWVGILSITSKQPTAVTNRLPEKNTPGQLCHLVMLRCTVLIPKPVERLWGSLEFAISGPHFHEQKSLKSQSWLQNISYGCTDHSPRALGELWLHTKREQSNSVTIITKEYRADTPHSAFQWRCPYLFVNAINCCCCCC